jgi:hypothetical protein
MRRIYRDMLQNVWWKKNVASMFAQPEKQHMFYLCKEEEEEGRGESLFPFA